jgi:hypothetical protein
MTKLKAFATHIGISIVIFILVVSYMIYFWYPQPFFLTDGGWQGIRIIAAVDLVLGPVLTLIVYKPKKPGLKMDLTIIGLVQAGALSWGIWIVHYERPIAAVYAEGAFISITANAMQIKGMSEDDFRQFGNRIPAWIYCKLPEDPDKLQEIRKRALQFGRPVHMEKEYYVRLDKTVRAKLISESFDLSSWVKDKPDAQSVYKEFEKKYKTEIDNIIFVPWRARYSHNFLALRKSDMSYVDILDIPPP